MKNKHRVINFVLILVSAIVLIIIVSLLLVKNNSKKSQNNSVYLGNEAGIEMDYEPVDRDQQSLPEEITADSLRESLKSLDL